MTKEIPLTHGYIAIVDDEDYEYLNQFNWMVTIKPRMKTPYADRRITYSRGNYGHITMHRDIFNLKRGNKTQIDHINKNGLDNRRCNLRICTQSQNMTNIDKPKTNTSGYKGVSWHNQGLKWRAQIRVNGEYYSLGLYTNKEDAARAYDKKARELCGEFAVLNFP